jgi:polymorphic toxin system nucleotidyltransferase-like protein
VSDPGLTIVQAAQRDPNVVAAILHGSRAAGHARDNSDYDVCFVVVDESAPPPSAPDVDAMVVSLDRLRTAEPTWWTDGLVQGRVLLDRSDGELPPILARLCTTDDVAGPYDAYLNAFVRGKAAARRGDELGARLHAGDSVRHLVAALAALEGRRPLFHDRLAGTLDGWEPQLLALLREPTAEVQLALFADVRAHMDTRGILTHDTWKPDQLA